MKSRLTEKGFHNCACHKRGQEERDKCPGLLIYALDMHTHFLSTQVSFSSFLSMALAVFFYKIMCSSEDYIWEVCAKEVPPSLEFSSKRRGWRNRSLPAALVIKIKCGGVGKIHRMSFTSILLDCIYISMKFKHYPIISSFKLIQGSKDE